MFKALEVLLQQTTLIVTIAQPAEGRMKVTVSPKCKEGANAGLSTPLVLEGTAEELDAEFARLVESYSSSRKSLAEQLAAAEAVMQAAKETASKTASKAATKSSAAATKGKAASGTSSPPVATGDEVDEEDNDGEQSQQVAANSTAPEKKDETQESLFG